MRDRRVVTVEYNNTGCSNSLKHMIIIIIIIIRV